MDKLAICAYGALILFLSWGCGRPPLTNPNNHPAVDLAAPQADSVGQSDDSGGVVATETTPGADAIPGEDAMPADTTPGADATNEDATPADLTPGPDTGFDADTPQADATPKDADPPQDQVDPFDGDTPNDQLVPTDGQSGDDIPTSDDAGPDVIDDTEHPVVFSTEIAPLLASCKLCHSGHKGDKPLPLSPGMDCNGCHQGGYTRFTLKGDDLIKDFGNLAKQVLPADPPMSNLVLTVSVPVDDGGIHHYAGKLIPSGFPSYDTLLRWIGEGSQLDVTLSYATTVTPILQTRCSSGNCHSGSPNGSVLDHATILAASDLNTPSQSLLLKKGANQVSHGGGARLNSYDDLIWEYYVLLEWIRQGALDN